MLAFAAILATLDDPFYDPPEHLVKYETPQQRRSYTAWASKLRDDLIGGAARAADRHGGKDAPAPDVKHGRAAPPDVGRPAEHARGEFGGGEQPWRGRRRGARRLTLKVSSAI